MLRVLCCVGVGTIATACHAPAPPLPSPSQASRASWQYYRHDLPTAIVHRVVIPNQDRYQVTVGITDQLATVPEFAAREGAIAVLNGGFFDPSNQQTTAFASVAGQLRLDPRQNQRLMHNPKLAPYLDRILNRSEFRQYRCGARFRYAITRHQTPVPSDCQLQSALGGGPQLLPKLTPVAEGFYDHSGPGVRDPLGVQQPNARSAIGITATGEMVWVMVAQHPEGGQGLSLPDLAQFMAEQGVEQALNLDGGSSSALVVQNKTYFGKAQKGQPVVRPVKSVLLLRKSSAP